EARAHAHPLPRDGDLAQHEPVAALDEAGDALGHGPERDEARHAHRDADHGEGVAARKERGEPHHPSLDSPARRRRLQQSLTTRPRQRRRHRLTRTMTKKPVSEPHIRRRMRRKAPPASTPVTLSSMASRSLGRRKISTKAGSYQRRMKRTKGLTPRRTRFV